jgi:hypothetical protein
MSIDLENITMKGKLKEREEQVLRLRNRFEALAMSMRHGLNTRLTDIEDIDVPQLCVVFDDLKACWAAALNERLEIHKLKKELGC